MEIHVSHMSLCMVIAAVIFQLFQELCILNKTMVLNEKNLPFLYTLLLFSGKFDACVSSFH